MKKVKCWIMVITLILSFVLNSQRISAVNTSETAIKVVKNITAGWNLGNSFVCCDNKTVWDVTSSVNKENYYETLWGNPKTTEAMIQTVRVAGFNAVRIPVTYYNHLDAYGKIDEAWLNRVGEVVQYALNNEMYVIINIHHETGYGNKPIQANLANIENTKAYANVLWMQIANYFKEYDSKLMFEGFNEVLDMSAQNPWYGNQNSWNAMNMLNQSFVDTIRATGGNNSRRNLIVNTYGAQTTEGPLKYFVMPNDVVKDHLIAGVHLFSTNGNEIKSTMGTLNYYFVQKGYPVLLTETGTAYQNKNMQARVATATCYKAFGDAYGIKVFWWDDGGNYRLLNRRSNTWYYPEIVKALTK